MSGQYQLQSLHGNSASAKSHTIKAQLCGGISDGFSKDLEQERLARLGCHILANGAHGYLTSGTSIWSRLLPQLSNAIPSVNAAAAALGSIYESTRLVNRCSSLSNRTAAIQYGTAISKIQQDLASQPHGSVPLILSCALLAFAELLQHHQYNALMHFQGALKLLCNRNNFLIQARASDVDDAATPVLEDGLSLMFMKLDIQKASYALDLAPDLTFPSGRHLSHLSWNMRTILEAEQRLVWLIHSSYHFTAHASHFKYLAPGDVPSDLFVEQGRHIAQLLLWLDIINLDFLPTQCDPARKLPTDTFAHVLVLRLQCLSTLVYLSTVLSAHECSYDFHGPRFQTIVEDAAMVLDQDLGASSGLGQFRPCPGIIQPLFLSATKYRHPIWRRQAIELLQRSGREGPFDGALLAAVATRAVEIEEGECRPLETNETLLPIIPEIGRVHGCGLDAKAKDGEPIHTATVMFSRCRNVERMHSGSCSWDHSSNWIIWDEVITF